MAPTAHWTHTCSATVVADLSTAATNGQSQRLSDPTPNASISTPQAAQDEGTWPITSVDDGSLSMTPQGAAEFMKVVAVKEEEEDGEDDAGDDDDLDDMA